MLLKIAFVGLLINIFWSIVHLYRAMAIVDDTVKRFIVLNFVYRLDFSWVSLFEILVPISPHVKLDEKSNLLDPY